MKYIQLNIPVDDSVPEGYKLILAYAKDNEIVVPLSSVDEEEDANRHNCDMEGCTSVSHVVRFYVEDKYQQVKYIM